MLALLYMLGIWPNLFPTLFVITVTSVVIYYLVYVRQTNRWKQSNIPYAQPTFLIGHEAFLNANKYYSAIPIDEIYKENHDKDLVGFFMGPLPMILLRDQKLIHQVFGKKYSQALVPAISFSGSEADYSPLNEDTWKYGFGEVASVYSSTWFQGARFEWISAAIHEVRRQIESQGCRMEVDKIARYAALRINSYNLGEERNSHAIKDGLDKIVHDFFEPSLQRIMSLFLGGFFPFFQRLKPFQTVPPSSYNIISDILKQEIKIRDQMQTKIYDVVDVLRSYSSGMTSTDTSSEDSSLLKTKEETAIKQMCGLSLSFILPGTHAIITLVIFSMHALSLHPEHQHKMRREVQDTMKKHGVSDLNYEVVRDLSFTFQCLFEISRLYTISMVMRKCVKDVHISGTNYTLKKGDKVILPLYSIARDHTIFKDPHVFDPERFNSKGNLNTPASFVVFGTGPRKCPGYKYGLMAAASIVASIVLKYDVKPNSHLKLMDATDFDPKGFAITPRRSLVVDFFPADTLDDKNSNS